jgi:hypothetical protein
MLVLLECLLDLPRHGAVHMALLVVPCEFYATEKQSRPINSNLIVYLECRLEVIEISYVCPKQRAQQGLKQIRVALPL